MAEFGSLGAVVNGSPRRLARTAGKGVARLLAAHSQLLRAGLLEEVCGRPVLANRDVLFAYLQQEIGYAPEERLLALFLDGRVGLIKADLMSIGTVRGTSADAFAIFQRGKELGAAAVILAHNHPSGDTSASRADILVTNRLKRLGDDLDLPLLDHFIVASGQVTPVPIV